MKENDQRRSVSRKQFLAVGGAAAMVASVAAVAEASHAEQSVSPTTAPAAQARKWDCDVLVVGAGIAGLNAAIKAADLGAKVILLEKMADLMASATWKAGGNFGGAVTKMQIENKIVDSIDTMYNEMMTISQLKGNPEMMWVHCQNAGIAVDLLDDWGFELYKESIFLGHKPGKSVHEAYTIDRVPVVSKRPEMKSPAGGGATIVMALKNQLDKRIARKAVDLRFGARAKELILLDGRVVGCKVEDKAGVKDVYAKTVILATGGFMSDAKSLAKYTPWQSSALSTGAESSTGDGLNMATAIGADIYGMAVDYGLPYPGTIPHPAVPGRGDYTISMATPGIIWVDKGGKRFSAEDIAGERNQKLATMKADQQNVYVIFNETVLKDAKVTIGVWAGTALTGDALIAEAKKGVFMKTADTIDALAKALGLPADALKATVDKYNAGVTAGKDEFGRKELKYSLDKGPYYGMLTVLRNLSTKGGLLHNTDGSVIDTKGGLIPGLYAAGELASYGLLIGYATPGGSLLCHSMVMGRITGERAAREAQIVGLSVKL